MATDPYRSLKVVRLTRILREDCFDKSLDPPTAPCTLPGIQRRQRDRRNRGRWKSILGHYKIIKIDYNYSRAYGFSLQLPGYLQSRLMVHFFAVFKMHVQDLAAFSLW